MKRREVVMGILFRKWLKSEKPYLCERCNLIKKCSWGAVISGKKIKIVLRVKE